MAPVRFVEALLKKPAVRICLDTGTEEPEWEKVRRLRDALVARGWREPDELHTTSRPQAGVHNEAVWAARTRPLLRWLLAARPIRRNPQDGRYGTS